VWPQEAEADAGGHLEIDAGDRRLVAVLLDQALAGDGRLHRRGGHLSGSPPLGQVESGTGSRNAPALGQAAASAGSASRPRPCSFGPRATSGISFDFAPKTRP